MGTPFVTFLGPSNLDGYDRSRPPTEQPDSIPKTFLDALEVREQVFVQEQGVPLDNEFDSDDSRSCHWVVYASVNTVTDPQVKDAEGNIIQRKQSVTKSLPIGTIRLVPFPQTPHPEPGASYVANDLVASSNADPSTLPSYTVDRATTFHDGKEPYIKLGRLAVLKEFRGAGLGKLLVSSAVSWAQQNPTYFNPSVKSLGMEKIGATSMDEIPVWNGLVCVHAQKQVAKTYIKWGFEIDEGMGEWVEEGMSHVGMFKRVKLSNSS